MHVWHERDRSILAQVTDVGSVPSGASAQLPAGQQDPDGILGLSSQLLSLMRVNYRVAVAGRGQADDRPAQIVELRRPDGSLAARFWLDAVTKLPLRREIFGSSARMISEDAFIDAADRRERAARHAARGRPAMVRPAGPGTARHAQGAGLAAAGPAARQPAARRGAPDRHHRGRR